jgi:peroxiredoxin
MLGIGALVGITHCIDSPCRIMMYTLPPQKIITPQKNFLQTTIVHSRGSTILATIKILCMKRISMFLLACSLSTTLFAQTEAKKPEGLKVGDDAPAISTVDNNGKKIELAEILKKGEVVIVFYRGQWCPYCNKQLSQLNDELASITAKGATVIAITPETGDNVKKTVEKTKASFSIIEDTALKIMNDYKVTFAVDEATITKYKKYGIDFEKANGANGANLPVPATYIIGTNGKIKYVYFNPDYSKRASVKEILTNLN